MISALNSRGRLDALLEKLNQERPDIDLTQAYK
jgi:hypothetical protein